MLRLVTWNINSVRARLDLVGRLLEREQPDILCLQETKVIDEAFPRGFFADRGYAHAALHGQKNHHGVAILSRTPLDDAIKINWCGKGDARHIGIRLPQAPEIRLENFYVPAGGDIPDPVANDKFAHKLAFVEEMTDWAEKLDTPTILVGDLNIAPLPSDVWSHRQLLDVVSHTPAEVERMEKLIAAHGFVDVMREIVPETEKLFSWWSYRAQDWRASNRGRRLDHVWVSPTLKPAIRAMRVLEQARDWEKPSDHAPVIVDFEF